MCKGALSYRRTYALDRFKKMEKANEITKYDEETAEKDVQKITDKYVAEIDSMVDKKSKEILSV